MRAKAIAWTRSDEIDDIVAYCARVSNPGNQHNDETAPKLLRYLIRNKHWSPFEIVNVVMEVETTRDIARQLLRHRSFSFQEFSARYANPLEELGFMENREARLQDPKNKQNSVEIDPDDSLGAEWSHQQDYVKNVTRTAYKWAIDNGIAKEQARVVLPEGLIMSRLYVNGTIRSWFHYCELRGFTPGTQKEHAELARNCWWEIEKIFPSLAGLLKVSEP